MSDCVVSKGLSFKMKWKLWPLAFVLALLKTWLVFFRGGLDGLWPQGQSQSSTTINHLTTPQSPPHGSLVGFPGDPVEEPYFHNWH